MGAFSQTSARRAESLLSYLPQAHRSYLLPIFICSQVLSFLCRLSDPSGLIRKFKLFLVYGNIIKCTIFRVIFKLKDFLSLIWNIERALFLILLFLAYSPSPAPLSSPLLGHATSPFSSASISKPGMKKEKYLFSVRFGF